MRTKVFLAVGLLVALVLAGVVSFYASSSPDGLEKVAEDKGFASSAKRHDLADSPFADYTSPVDDERWSGGVAGVLGVVVTFAVAGGIAYVVRRRSGSRTHTSSD